MATRFIKHSISSFVGFYFIRFIRCFFSKLMECRAKRRMHLVFVYSRSMSFDWHAFRIYTLSINSVFIHFEKIAHFSTVSSIDEIFSFHSLHSLAYVFHIKCVCTFCFYSFCSEFLLLGKLFSLYAQAHARPSHFMYIT